MFLVLWPEVSFHESIKLMLSHYVGWVLPRDASKKKAEQYLSTNILLLVSSRKWQSLDKTA